jgi:hypothetical protein
MKSLIGIILLVSFQAVAQTTYRTFTSTDGRALKAVIIDFNEPKDEVTIQREDGKKISVKPAAFSEQDQAYIQNWYAAKVFMSENKFQLKLNDKKGETTKKNHEVDYSEQNSGRGSGRGMQIVAVDQTTVYDLNLTLKNTSTAELKNMMLEYRMYYEQQKAEIDEEANESRPNDDESIPDRHMAVDEQKVKEGSARLKPAEPGSERTITPGNIKLLKRTATGRGYGDKINLDSKLIGAWARLTMKGPDGETLTRDVATSSTIMKKFPWDTPEEQLVVDAPEAAASAD